MRPALKNTPGTWSCERDVWMGKNLCQDFPSRETSSPAQRRWPEPEKGSRMPRNFTVP
jgi:hypothetical protein